MKMPRNPLQDHIKLGHDTIFLKQIYNVELIPNLIIPSDTSYLEKYPQKLCPYSCKLLLWGPIIVKAACTFSVVLAAVLVFEGDSDCCFAKIALSLTVFLENKVFFWSLLIFVAVFLFQVPPIISLLLCKSNISKLLSIWNFFLYWL